MATVAETEVEAMLATGMDGAREIAPGEFYKQRRERRQGSGGEGKHRNSEPPPRRSHHRGRVASVSIAQDEHRVRGAARDRPRRAPVPIRIK